MSVVAAEVLAEGIEAAQSEPVLRGAEARNEHPRVLVRMKPVARVDGALAIGLRRDEESLRRAGLPVVDQVRVAAGPLVPEHLGHHPVALGDELREVVGGDGAAVLGIRAVGRVPHREDDAAFGGGVHLHAEVSAREAGGHVIRGDRIIDRGDFVVEAGDGDGAVGGVTQVHARRIAARVEVEVRARAGRAVDE